MTGQRKDGPDKFFDWHHGLDNKIKTRRMVGRPKRRWEDDINEFIKPEETKERIKYDLTNNNNWVMEAKNTKNGKKKKKVYQKSAAIVWNDARWHQSSAVERQLT